MKTNVVARFGLCFIFLIFLIGQMGCPGVEYPNCKTDAQCKTGSGEEAKSGVCVFGKCQECAKDTDCPAGKQCKDNMCLQMCTSDADCDVSSHCDAGVCRINCEDASSCGDGMTCYNGRCLTQTTCIENKDCESGFTCESGLCVQSTLISPELACTATGMVFFDFDKRELMPEGREVIEQIAICVRENPNVKLLISGHADNRGSEEYNLPLSEDRARAVSKYLNSLGVSSKNVRIIGYGHNQPLDPALNEAAWAKNRRAEINVE